MNDEQKQFIGCLLFGLILGIIIGIATCHTPIRHPSETAAQVIEQEREQRGINEDTALLEGLEICCMGE